MAEKPARVRDPRCRERILTAAADLMSQHGYQLANLSEIGAEAGIVGSGIYRHFNGKSAILVEFFDRVVDRLICDAEDSLRHDGDAIWTLDHLVTAQVQFTMDERQLYQVYLHEARNLPPADLSRLREKQRTYVGICQETLSLCPSMSRSGTIRWSQRGAHQVARPKTANAAGMSVIRTRNASMSTPTARVKPIWAIIVSGEKMKPANTDAMMIAAATTTREVAENRLITACCGLSPRRKWSRIDGALVLGDQHLWKGKPVDDQRREAVIVDLLLDLRVRLLLHLRQERRLLRCGKCGGPRPEGFELLHERLLRLLDGPFDMLGGVDRLDDVHDHRNALGSVIELPSSVVRMKLPWPPVASGSSSASVSRTSWDGVPSIDRFDVSCTPPTAMTVPSTPRIRAQAPIAIQGRRNEESPRR